MTGLSSGNISTQVVVGPVSVETLPESHSATMEFINAVLAKLLGTKNSSASVEGRKGGNRICSKPKLTSSPFAGGRKAEGGMSDQRPSPVKAPKTLQSGWL